MILSFQIDRPGQTVQTRIEGAYCLQFHLHLLEALLYVKTCFFYQGDDGKFFGCPNF